MEDNSTTEIVNIRYSSNCNKKNSKRRKKCKNIPLGTAVEFTADITLKKCERQTGKQDQLMNRCNEITSKSVSVVISPVGMEDTLVLDIEPLCDCECGLESSSSYDHTSEYCEFHGNICLVLERFPIT